MILKHIGSFAPSIHDEDRSQSQAGDCALTQASVANCFRGVID
jgi:hypothetical protein